MREQLLRLRDDLGALGWLSLALIALAAAFAFLVVKPLEKRNAALAERLAELPAAEHPGTAADKVASVYGFLEKPEEATDWLAKLHGIGTATGVQLRSATYKTRPTDGRIVRYEIALPVSGTYPQIRDFLKRSLAEIPVLSVDQLTLKREDGAGGGVVHAELRLTLHMVKS
jgi:hypothetical protein